MKGLIAALALLVVLGLGFFLYSSPAAPPAEMTEAEIAQVEAEMEALEVDLTRALVGADFGAFQGFFSEDLSWAMYGEVHHSLSSWLEEAEPFFAQPTGMERCDWVDRRFQVLPPNVVISTSDLHCFGPSTEGSLVLVDHTLSIVWASEAGQWKIVNFAETFPTEAPEGS